MAGDDWEETTDTEDVPSAREPGPDRPSVVVLSGPNQGETVRLGRDETTFGRSDAATIKFADSGISRTHCAIARNAEGLVLRDLGSLNGTFCNGVRVEDARVLVEGDKIQLGRTILKFTFLDDLDESYQRHMVDSALRDELTHAYNRRYLRDRLDTELSAARRHHVPLAVLVMDLDHFKKVNDEFGHPAGDVVLSTFAERVRKMMRSEDVFARYGGEEFAAVLRSTDEEGARVLAERVRRATEALVCVHQGKSIRVTVSIGAAAYPDLELGSGPELIAAADQALYQAKARGRNCVVVCSQWDLDETTNVEL